MKRMEILFNEFKEFEIVHPTYKGKICGYNDEHFILAVEASSSAYCFRRLPKESFVLEEYRDNRYKYVYENESEIIKQMKYANLSTNKQKA